jgi:two-component system, cell cycle sensor histidine kinase and response regulator CckA
VSLAYSRNSTVLVVEDDPRLREFYRTALTAAGYTVVAVGDGLDALRRIDHRAPQAVVLDLSLPRVNGRDVSRELKARPDTREIPIIVVTGTAMGDLDHQEFACVLRKPVGAEALIDAIERCLRAARRTTC